VIAVSDSLDPRGAMTRGRDPERAFRWIVRIVEDWAIPFLLVGGLAARVHRASRDLADIDCYILAYKHRLQRPVDLADIWELEA
jgi:hypothetical protein